MKYGRFSVKLPPISVQRWRCDKENIVVKNSFIVKTLMKDITMKGKYYSEVFNIAFTLLGIY